MESTLLDSLIYSGIILLILSQITERITTFIREYIKVATRKLPSWEVAPPERFWRRIFKKLLKFLLLLDDVSDLAKSKIRTAISPEDKSRVEFAITKLSVLVGIVVAFCFGANLFELGYYIKTPPEMLGWKGFSFEGLEPLKILQMVFYQFTGCLATGFFLSFGSGFFHDLLDMLYDVRRLRRKIADEYVFQSPDTEELLKRLGETYDEPVKLVLNRHRERLLAAFPDIVSIARTFDDQGNAHLEIQVTRPDVKALNAYKFDYLKGDKVEILPPEKITIRGGAVPVKPLGDPSVWVGDWLFNDRTDDNKGTAGFFARQKGKPVLVTCYHVLKTPKHPWSGLGSTAHPDNQVYGKARNETSYRYLGNLSDGIINEWLDVAIVEMRDNVRFSNEDPFFGQLKVHATNAADVQSTVKINGAKSEPGIGVVHSIENTVNIHYGGKTVPMYHLLCIKNANGGAAITQPGDSGSVVVDIANNVVGMVVAGNDEYSFAIPINRILDTFDLA